MESDYHSWVSSFSGRRHSGCFLQYSGFELSEMQDSWTLKMIKPTSLISNHSFLWVSHFFPVYLDTRLWPNAHLRMWSRRFTQRGCNKAHHWVQPLTPLQSSRKEALNSCGGWGLPLVCPIKWIQLISQVVRSGLSLLICTYCSNQAREAKWLSGWSWISSRSKFW